MKLGFLALPARERRLYIEEVASRRDVSPVVVEKDFWVSWMLALLFRSECADALVFKGGTSLSKVFGAIDRFSEDIDLSLSPAFAGIDGPTATQTRTQADLWMARAQKACGEAVAERISPALATLARKEFGAGIARRLAPEGDGTTLLFKYPSVLPSGFDYLQRSVRLEFGSLTDQQPTGRHPVRRGAAQGLRGDARHVPRATSVLRRSPRDACAARGAHQCVSAASVRGDARGFVAMKSWSAPRCTIAARPPPSHMRKVPLSRGFCI